ncbi:MAG: hypothetical protein DRQ01_02890 [Ignavibacteriae bacterium]|nr:MAG: hypothetical protein DRQ01_02890 [Ignavibacteriota bacterium]
MIKLKQIASLFFVINFLLLINTGCDDTLTADEVDNIVMPDSNVSYADHIAVVFEFNCNRCHNPSQKEGGVDLSTWSGIVADPRIVFPGSDSTSVLVWTIEYKPGFPPMPPLQYRGLVLNHIKGIRTWISEGAKNN